MSLSDHVVRVIHLKFVFSLQVNRYVLLVRKSFLTHRTFESVLDPALEPHVPVEIIVPVIRFPAFLAFEGLPACRPSCLHACWTSAASSPLVEATLAISPARLCY